MDLLTALPVEILADASAASNVMKAYVTPLLGVMVALASVAVVFFLVYGGIQYMTSTGDPEKLDHAKKVLRNALIGLVVIIAAGTLTAILSQAYNSSAGTAGPSLPQIIPKEPETGPTNVGGIIAKAITEVLEGVVKSVGQPFLDSLKFFTESTPLMADNSSVFNLWLVIAGISNVIFIAVTALLGFHVMSATTFGFDEIEFKHLLPRLGLIFLLINTSIFAIDAVVSLSNAMIDALRAGFPLTNVWKSLTEVIMNTGNIGMAVLLIMGAFLILSVMLLVYYVLRLVTLYLGAVLSPLIFLIWLLPPFRDFAQTAMKVYITTIFVLFVHVVILGLAASIFTGMADGDQPLNPVMSMIVGVATLLALLKTQGVMSQFSYVSLGPKTARKLGGQLTNAVSYVQSRQAMRKADAAEAKTPGRPIPQGNLTKRVGRSETTHIPRSKKAKSSNVTRMHVTSGDKPKSGRRPAGGATSNPRTRIAPKVTKEKS